MSIYIKKDYIFDTYKSTYNIFTKNEVSFLKALRSSIGDWQYKCGLSCFISLSLMFCERHYYNYHFLLCCYGLHFFPFCQAWVGVATSQGCALFRLGTFRIGDIRGKKKE
jgi:hypothetical protein